MDLDPESFRLLQEEFQHEFFSPAKVNLSDSLIARQLQEEFEQELASHTQKNEKHGHTAILSDSLLARRLHEEFQQEEAIERPVGNLVYDKKKKNRHETKSLVDPSWEVIDPTPDVHLLFIAFNKKFFWGKLDSVCVSWSTKMKRCAGICSYQGRGGLCHISLSEPLLKLRPRKDLVETLLHEMIHAYLFVTNNNKDRDGHGPEFHKHMYRINTEAGTNVTVYHDFHDEVELYLQHWWRCSGPCQKWKPYFGIVRRSSNRAPGPNDKWWKAHSTNCGGTFLKIQSPEPKSKTVNKRKANKPTGDIRKYIETTAKTNNPKSIKPGTSSTSKATKTPVISSTISGMNIHTVPKPSTSSAVAVTIPSKTNNIHGFSSSGSKTSGGAKGLIKNSSSTITVKNISTTISDSDKSSTTDSSIISPVLSKKEAGNEPPMEYEVVRNHWLNKFSNNSNLSTASVSSMNSSSIKRKPPESLPAVSKLPKLTDSSSQFSGYETADCPVCNISYPIKELNSHLDMCLATLSNHQKECIICLKYIDKSEYQQHVNACVENNFDDVFIEDSREDNDVILIDDEMVCCEICRNSISKDDILEHSKICGNRTKCPECNQRIDVDCYDVHLAECLMKKLDEIEQNINPAGNIEKVEDSDIIEKVDCLVCSKKIEKSNLNSHLDECLRGVFDDQSEKNQEEDDDKFYNCPFCLKLVTEIEMSDHIDICLNVVDDDAEAQNNKSVFLNELDALV